MTRWFPTGRPHLKHTVMMAGLTGACGDFSIDDAFVDSPTGQEEVAREESPTGSGSWTGLGVRTQLAAGWNSVSRIAGSATPAGNASNPASAEDAPEMSAGSNVVRKAKHGARAAVDGAWRAMGWLGDQFQTPPLPASPPVGAPVPKFLQDQVPKAPESPSAEDL